MYLVLINVLSIKAQADSPTLKKNYGTHVIKLDIAPVAYPLGQHLFISASNNMFYRHSQWDKRHTICVVNLMPQDSKNRIFKQIKPGLEPTIFRVSNIY